MPLSFILTCSHLKEQTLNHEMSARGIDLTWILVTPQYKLKWCPDQNSWNLLSYCADS